MLEVGNMKLGCRKWLRMRNLNLSEIFTYMNCFPFLGDCTWIPPRFDVSASYQVFWQGSNFWLISMTDHQENPHNKGCEV